MLENQPLAGFTTLGIGGPARWLVEAATEDDIAEAVQWAAGRGIDLFVLGGGSNLLVADRGFDGLVLRVGLRGVGVEAAHRASHDTQVLPLAPLAQDDSLIVDREVRLYRAAAGENWDRFVERTVLDNCAGIECLAGIPGTVGGTPVQNVGAYGQEVASSIAGVRAYDREERAFVQLSAEQCGFAYRRSRFNSSDRGRYIVTRVDYRLTGGGAPTLRYADVQRALADVPAPSLADAAAAVRQIRQSKGMLLVEGDPDCRSAGSFFKNPVVSEEQVRTIADAGGIVPPRFPAGLGQVKLPAAWLIEQAGFAKGYARGAAGISSRHTLALVNRGGANAAEMLALADEIADAVESRFGIRLEREPVMLGF